jgi:hypothetical protein
MAFCQKFIHTSSFCKNFDYFETVITHSVLYERPIVTFQLLESSQFQHTEFTNSRIKLYEFYISNSRIHDFIFTNSQFQLHEYNFMNSCFVLHDITFLNSRFQLRNDEILESWSSKHKFMNLYSWNCEIMKLK